MFWCVALKQLPVNDLQRFYFLYSRFIHKKKELTTTKGGDYWFFSLEITLYVR